MKQQFPCRTRLLKVLEQCHCQCLQCTCWSLQQLNCGWYWSWCPAVCPNSWDSSSNCDYRQILHTNCNHLPNYLRLKPNKSNLCLTLFLLSLDLMLAHSAWAEASEYGYGQFLQVSSIWKYDRYLKAWLKLFLVIGHSKFVISHLFFHTIPWEALFFLNAKI